MATSREQDVETVIINLLGDLPALAGIDIRHFVRAATPDPDQITVKATRGQLVLLGPGGFEYSLEISVGLGIRRDVATSDFIAVINAIDSEMCAPTGTGGVTDYFEYFEIREDQESTKDAAGKDNRRVATYTIHAAGEGGAVAITHKMDFSTSFNSFYLPLV